MKEWYCGKKIVLTGASSGFGKYLAEKLVKRYGCTVFGIARNAEKLQRLKDELGEKFDYRAFDVGDENEWVALADDFKSKEFFPDVLINNAGILPQFSAFSKTERGQAERVFATNFFASVYSVRAILPMIKEKSDCPAVINVSSSACFAQVIGTSLYSASKSALASFTKTLALEQPDVYVALVCPGFADTDIFRSQDLSDEIQFEKVRKACSSPDDFTDKMLRAFAKKRKHVTLGADAKAMQFFGRVLPKSTDKIIANFLRKKRLSMFKNVFED